MENSGLALAYNKPAKEGRKAAPTAMAVVAGKGVRVYVYRNLHRDCWSLKAVEGPDKGKVIGYADTLVLKWCAFKVSEAGRQRVLREKQRNVHAGIVGVQVEMARFAKDTEITYNPYKYTCFVYKADGKPVEDAAYIMFDKDGKVYVK